jgi:hypothetical protein
MSTLAEIEAATDDLPAEQKQERDQLTSRIAARNAGDTE